MEEKSYKPVKKCVEVQVRIRGRGIVESLGDESDRVGLIKIAHSPAV